MQPLTAAPRADLTEDQVRDLLTGHIEISAGLELLDSSNRYVADLTDDLVAAGSTVDHDGRAAAVHRSCVLNMQRTLAWGSDRVRVFMTLSNAGVSARFNVGVFVLTTPQRKEGETPITYEVHGYDLLQPLLDSPGDTYVVVPDEGEELVNDPSFETGIDDWDSNPGFGAMTPATLAWSTSHPSDGTHSLEVTWPDSPQSWANTHTASFVVGKTYLFATDVWVPLDGPDAFRFEALFWAFSPWFAPVKGASNHFEWTWTATHGDVFIGLTAQDTVDGTKTWVDGFHVTALSTTCLDAVKAALEFAGVGAPVRLDGTEQVAVMPGPMVWALTENSQTTWLSIINDMLAAVNYRPLWVDEEGTYRSEPYLDPLLQPAEWTFTVEDTLTTIVGPGRTYDEDTWGKPNWWRFIRRGMDSTPVEGAGMYTVQNLNRGPSSQQSLRRIVRKPPVFLDAVDQAALEAQGDRTVTEDTTITRTVTIDVDPLPIAGHLDVVQIVDNALAAKAQVSTWQLQLDGSPGQWVLEVVE